MDFSLPIKNSLAELLRESLAALAQDLHLDPSDLEARLNSEAKAESPLPPIPATIETLNPDKMAKFGDYACTLAMQRGFREFYAQAQPAFQNPHKLAQALREKLKGQHELLEEVEIAGPGFLNLKLKNQN